jgi:hypothetical protein
MLFYNQMHKFTFKHDHKFWTILIMKDIKKSRSNTKIKTQYDPNLKSFLNGRTHDVDLLTKYIKAYNTFGTFDGSLNNKKYIPFYSTTFKYCSTNVLPM